MKTTWDIMGMPITLEALGAHVTQAAFDETARYFRHVDRVFSTYKPRSEISRINNGTLRSSAASAEVQEVLAECQRLNQVTDGYFDIHHNDAIDPSGYVKGWAIKNAVALLEQHGISRYCLEAGGDIQVRGLGPTKQPWKIGIVNPLEQSTLAKVIYLTQGAVATSGIYKRGTHIYNPRTGELITDPLGLTVIGSSIDQVDALATAAFCMGKEGLAFLQSHGMEAMMITANSEVWLTSGFNRYEQSRS